MYQLLTRTYPEEVQKLFGDLCAQAVLVMECQLADQLPGGVFWEPSPELEDQAKSCSARNISSEHTFGRVDAMCHKASNMAAGKLEARVMFSVNETETWLQNQTADERGRCIALARKDAAKIRMGQKAQAE